MIPDARPRSLDKGSEEASYLVQPPFISEEVFSHILTVQLSKLLVATG